MKSNQAVIDSMLFSSIISPYCGDLEMGMVKKSITVTDQQEEWIKGQIASGSYGNDSEVFRDLIRQRQAQNSEIENIRASLNEAEQRNFTEKTAEDIRQDARKRLKENGFI